VRLARLSVRPLGGERVCGVVQVMSRPNVRGRTIIATISLAVGIVMSACYQERVNRSRQARTISTMIGYSQALKCYHEAHRCYPLGNSVGDMKKAISGHVDVAARSLPLSDGWGTVLEYRSNGSSFNLRSLGADHARDTSDVNGPRSEVSADIVVRDLVFVSYPAGKALTAAADGPCQSR
jgi:hypothetical protein